MYQRGDLVIFRMQKESTHPGRRAAEVHPAPHGETYSYVVDKFWIVADVRENGRLQLKTRRGKEHLVDADDPHLRRARWWEKLMYGGRFPKLSDE